MKQLILFLFDFLVPRFVKEDVVVKINGDEYEVVCCLGDVLPGEEFDGICEMESFSWLGMGFFGKMKIPHRKFKNPHT